MEPSRPKHDPSERNNFIWMEADSRWRIRTDTWYTLKINSHTKHTSLLPQFKFGVVPLFSAIATTVITINTAIDSFKRNQCKQPKDSYVAKWKVNADTEA